MKKIVLITAILLLCGCDSTVKRKSEEANVLSGAYVRQLDKTTPAQDKEHIRAMDMEIFQFDAALRGIEKAKKTRALVAPVEPETTTGGK